MSIDPLSLAITAALTAASMAMQMTQKIEGPRLDDLTLTVADYGTPLAYFEGKRRLEMPCFFTEPITEIKQKQKTKGGKYEQYTYFATWALVIADHEIDKFSRMWLDRHLALDLTGVGPATPFEFGEYNKSARRRLQNSSTDPLDHIRIYLGTEEQEADPRMLSYVENIDGPGTCPAYKGLAYVFLEDLPLEKFGNRRPQASGEAITAASPIYPYESFSPQPPGMYHLSEFVFSPDYSKFLTVGGFNYEIWDTAARTQIRAGLFGSGAGAPAISNDGTIYRIGADAQLWAYDADGGTGANISGTDITTSQSDVYVRMDGNDVEHVFTIPFSWGTTWFSLSLAGGVGGIAEHDTLEETGWYWKPYSFFTDDHGDIWAVGSVPNVIADVPDHFFMQRVVNTGVRPGSPGFARIEATIPGANFGSQVYGVHRDNYFVISFNLGVLYKVDEDTLTITDEVIQGVDVYNARAQWSNVPPGSNSIWLGTTEFSLITFTAIRTVSPSDWLAQDAGGIVYDPINHALICGPQFADAIVWRYLDRVGSDGVTLRHIVEVVSGRAGIDLADIDATALTQLVRGFSYTQGPAKDVLAGLLELYDVDPRPHNFQIQFVVRGGSPGHTLETENFVRKGSDNPRYEWVISSDTDIPRRLFLNFADIDADQQPNAAIVQRPLDSLMSRRELTVDMTGWVATVDEAKQRAERLFRRRHFGGREKITLALTAMELAIEPADVHTIDLDGHEIIARMETLKIGADGVLSTTWERDHPRIADLSTSIGAPAAGRPISQISVSGLSKGFVLDVPLLSDAHDQANPFLYVAAAPYTPTVAWSGSNTLISPTGDVGTYLAGWDATASTDGVTWGVTNDALPDAQPEVFDDGSSIEVFMQYGTLDTVTEDELLADYTLNQALIGNPVNGWEKVQFRTATLIAAQTYQVSGFIRGAGGTEGKTGGHVAGDNFILASSLIHKHSLGASDIGDTNYYRTVTQGRTESSGSAVSVTFNAEANRPRTPAHVEITPDGDDWNIGWLRRSRIGGNLIAGRDVPLGETSESYEVEIMDGDLVVRTIPATTHSAVYTAAEQVSDFGFVQPFLNVRVYQLSPTLALRSDAATASAASAGPGAFRYWRVRSDDTWIAGDYLGIAELQLHYVAGGIDQTTGKTATSSATAGDPYLPPKAIDDDPATFFTTGGIAPPTGGHWLEIDFGFPVLISEAVITVRPDGFREDPVTLYFDGSSDEDDWTNGWSVTGIPAWSAGETRTFTAPYA